jgi:hypothetical protein
VKLADQPLFTSAVALVTLSAVHQVRPLPWTWWATWGAWTALATAETARGFRVRMTPQRLSAGAIRSASHASESG